VLPAHFSFGKESGHISSSSNDDSIRKEQQHTRKKEGATTTTTNNKEQQPSSGKFESRNPILLRYGGRAASRSCGMMSCDPRSDVVSLHRKQRALYKNKNPHQQRYNFFPDIERISG
jgi:hypothetical protein